jgi:predicted house-cleaning noncanonical NTP pyrophosphatase (MazG superfamily)
MTLENYKNEFIRNQELRKLFEQAIEYLKTSDYEKLSETLIVMEELIENKPDNISSNDV